MIASQRALFDLPREVIYLNAAYMGPMPRSAVAAGRESFDKKARPWRYRVQDDFFDAPDLYRARAGRLFGAGPDAIALVPAVSYGLATAAANLHPAAGSECLVLDEQFPSNVYVWRALAESRGCQIRTVRRSDNESWTDALLEAIGPRTGLIACPHTHWIDGGRIDLERVGAAARAQGARLVLDLTQSLGALPFSVETVQPDFAVAAGYKWMLGPYALGALYVAPEHRHGRPLEMNWIAREGAEDFSRLVDYADGVTPGAQRFDMGERSQFQLLPAANEALRQLLDWGVEAISDTLAARTAQIAEALAPLGLVDDVPDRSPHYLGLRLPDGAPDDLVDRLARRHVHVSRRGARLRITPHLYNDETDIAGFANALEDALRPS